MGQLKERLAVREEALRAGRYPDLRLRKKDPIRYELLFTRLLGIVQNAWESAKRVSASPVVREMGECIFALFTPEGESICFSNGLLVHVASLGGTIRWMLQNDYEEEVGIQEGDYFFNNDPHIGGAHSPDQSTVTPIFLDGEVIGWAGGLMHVLETGAADPGGAAPSAISRYEEGIFWPCVKVAEKERLRKDLEQIVIRGTRVPVYWLLDNRARMAGDQLIKEAVVQMIKEFGRDFYLEAIYEYIEDSRQAARKKIQSVLFPGKYSQIGFHDIPYKGMPVRVPRDYNIRIPVELTVSTDGTLSVDLDGASPPGQHPNNASLPCTIGTNISTLTQYLFYDLKPNQGFFQAFHLKVPPSVVNAPLSAACSIFSTALQAAALNTLNLSRGYYSMGYREEVTAGFDTGTGINTGGTDHYGRPFGALNFEAVCGGTGAMAVFDGLHTTYITFNPEGDCTDAEVWEKILPQMWLGRRIKLDSGGSGKYQGGGSLESLYFVEHSDDLVMGAIGSHHKVHTTPGLMGGYPAPALYHWISKNTNLKDRIDRQLTLPHSGGDDPEHPEWEGMIEGETELLPGQLFARPVNRYDLWQSFCMGGGGFGDPIERDPQSVKRDLSIDIVSAHVARSVYGVVMNAETGEVNRQETEGLRQAVRAQRRERGHPAREYWKGERQKILAGELPEMARSCLNECLASSVKFREEFRCFWDLDESFVRIPCKERSERS